MNDGSRTGRWQLDGSRPRSGVINADDQSLIRVGYVETGRGRIFTIVSQPAQPVGRAVIICQPFAAEAIRSHPLERALAHRLPSHGFTVARFHYLGAGHSDDQPDATSFPGLVADAVAISQHLRDAYRCHDLGFLGTRLGAYVAAAAAARMGSGPLVLWEPPLDPSRYFDEVFRAKLIGLVKQGERSPGLAKMMTMFADQGVMDVVGNAVTHDLYETTIGLDLVRMVKDARPERVQVVQMSLRADPRDDLVAAAEIWRKTGVRVDIPVVSYDEAWWFGAKGRGIVIDAGAGGMEVVPLTVEFLSAT